MGLFNNLTSNDLEETQDRLGGFAPLETDIYTGKIKAAYAGQSQGGAHSVTAIIALEGGREYRETFWVTNRKGENFYLNPQDKTKKVGLPGFTVVDEICLVTNGKPLSEQETAEKVINVYDPDLKKEAPKSVDMLIDLIGEEVSLGILNSLENKTEKDNDGNYVPTAETRNVNTVEKVFHTGTKMTVAEARDGKEAAVFWDSWLERNKGKTRDKTNKDGAKSGRPGNPAKPVQGEGGSERKSLFAK